MVNKELRAALFDLDGVVFDTEHPGLEHEIKGQTLQQIYDKWWSGELVASRELVTKRLNVFEAQMHYDYIAGLEIFIGDLRKNGVKTAVVTSSNVPKMQSVYRSHPEFLQLFDAVLTSEDFAESKPSPDCYLKAAQRFDAQPDECVVFEDSFNGLRSGRNAGMFVVGLATTNNKTSIEPLSDCQISDYKNMNYKNLKELWQAI